MSALTAKALLPTSIWPCQDVSVATLSGFAITCLSRFATCARKCCAVSAVLLQTPRQTSIKIEFGRKETTA
ncbi:hypothetical protein PH7735_00451 [Shimia thalassica]|uniref:Uncharacterized protein n=1 Tax=Shimia thalassica TaxID=1715693 RepID=A0A0P1IB05_9RHOB|nr:hypothetical protein PH7735_00451 [Shimia thalassica]